jgi:hypothetical protein
MSWFYAKKEAAVEAIGEKERIVPTDEKLKVYDVRQVTVKKFPLDWSWVQVRNNSSSESSDGIEVVSLVLVCNPAFISTSPSNHYERPGL